MQKVEGYITIDASDYDDDLEIIVDEEGIADLMDCNNISIDDMIETFDLKLKGETSIEDVDKYIIDVADHDDIQGIISVCLKRLTNDFNFTFSQNLELRREVDKLRAEARGGSHVSEIRPSC